MPTCRGTIWQKSSTSSQIYKDLEGKRVQIVGWEKSEVAMQVIMESIDRYAALYPSAAH